MTDSDQRSVSNRRPLLKKASTDVIISNDDPILGYFQIGVLSKLSYLFPLCGIMSYRSFVELSRL